MIQLAPYLDGHLMAAVDLETTGTQPGYHEIIQIAILPLDGNLRPMEGTLPFYTHIKPLHPERETPAATAKHKIPMTELMLHAPEQDRVADWLVEWFENLKLPFKHCLIPLAHNWAFESSFLKAWLGVSMVDQLFHSHARDGMLYAIALNDLAVFRGMKKPFNYVSLGALCHQLGIVNINAHDALSDSIAEAEVYRALLTLNLV